MKKNIIIFLNQTSLSHTQLLQKKFLLELSRNFNLFIISNYDLTQIKFLSEIPHKKINYKFKKKNKFYYLIREINLNTTLNHKKNKTISDFSDIYINQKIHEGKKNFLFVNFFKILQSILQFKIFLNLFQKIQEILFYDKNLLRILKEINPYLILTSSPGWWEDDNILLFTSKKIKTKTVSILSSWDQPTGMGLIPCECDYFIVWSNQMKNDLLKFHKIDAYKIKILGAIHWDHYFKKIYKIKNIKKKKITLYLKSPTRTKSSEVIYFCKALSNINLNQNFDIMVRPHPIYYSQRYLKEFYKLKSSFKKFGNLKVQDLYPNKKLKKLLGENNKSLQIPFLINNEEESKKLALKTIITSDVIINFFSTVNIEASILNKPIINLNYSKKTKKSKMLSKKNLYLDQAQNHIQNIHNFKFSKTCNSLFELRLEIKKVFNNPNFKAREQKMFTNYMIDKKGDSIKRIAEFVNNI